MKPYKLDENKIIELYQNDKSSEEISKIFNVPNSHIILRVLDRNGIERRTLERASDIRCGNNIDIDKVIDLYEGGKSSVQIADMFNTTPSSILNKLKRRNIQTRSLSEAQIGKKRKPHSEEHKRLISEKLKGHPVSMETRKKISEAHTGEKNYMYGKVAWNKGISPSSETRIKMSKASKGRIVSEETKMKLSKAHRGEKHWNYKGGVSIFVKNLRGCYKYRQWRDDVFTKNDFTCQKCGERGCYLEAHHIKSYSSILRFYEITTLEDALNCAELWDINNGITLCKKCHKELHKKVI